MEPITHKREACTGQSSLAFVGRRATQPQCARILCAAENMQCTARGCLQTHVHLLGRLGVAP